MKVLRSGKAVEMPEPPASFQARVDAWLIACFGEEIARDPIERNHRFLEEALELVQSTGCTHSEAHQLVDYVFGREIGDPQQELGGVMVTLAALCLARGYDMADSGDVELARCWTKIEKIRAKQAAKPRHSPLPQSALPPSDPRDALIGTDVSDAAIADATIAEFAADRERLAKAWAEASASLEITTGYLASANAEIKRLRTFVRSARTIVQSYASDHPAHVWGGHEIDPMGAHGWLAAERTEIGTNRDGGDPKVEGA